ILAAALPLRSAAAQYVGMSGNPSAACQQLIVYRDDTQKHGLALQAAGKNKAPPEELCVLFKAFLAAETKMVKGLEENSATCRVPLDMIKQVKEQHNRAARMGEQVCRMAGGRPGLDGPRLQDPLGTTPGVLPPKPRDRFLR